MATKPRSPLALAALATAAVPGLDLTQARNLQVNSSDYEVVLARDAEAVTWVIRAPRTTQAAAKQEAEVQLLAALTGHHQTGVLPFAVPEPAGFAALPEGGRVMVYRQLPGHQIDVEALGGGPGLAAEIGRAIAALHNLPADLVSDTGQPTAVPETYRTEHLHLIDRATLTGDVPEPVLRRWETSLRDEALWSFTPTLIHGELAAEHLLTDGATVTGMVDFFDAKAADPAEDLSWLLQSAPIDAADAIFESYALALDRPVEETLWQRAALLSELAIARWLLYGVEEHDESIRSDAIEMLAELDSSIAGE